MPAAQAHSQRPHLRSSGLTDSNCTSFFFERETAKRKEVFSLKSQHKSFTVQKKNVSLLPPSCRRASAAQQPVSRVCIVKFNCYGTESVSTSTAEHLARCYPAPLQNKTTFFYALTLSSPINSNPARNQSNATSNSSQIYRWIWGD